MKDKLLREMLDVENKYTFFADTKYLTSNKLLLLEKKIDALAEALGLEYISKEYFKEGYRKKVPNDKDSQR